MEQIVLSIKYSYALQQVQKSLLEDFKAGRRNYTVFQIGKAPLLHVSDVMCLKYQYVYRYLEVLNLRICQAIVLQFSIYFVNYCMSIYQKFKKK